MELKDVKLVKGMTKDEVNELVGEWILFEDDEYLGVKYNHNWRCLCGNIIQDRIWDNIKRKNRTKCNKCTGFTSSSYNKDDYIGKRYGKLIILNESCDSTPKHRKMLCKCDCGNIKSVYLNSLRNGSTKSCGCGKFKYDDLTGKVFGRWKVLNLDEVRDGGQYYWKCECECGNVGVVRGSELKRNLSKSCGCYLKDLDKKRNFNKYNLENENGIGYTNNGDEFYFSKDDYDIIKKYTWHNKDGYIESVSFGEKIKMHNLIGKPNNGYVVDHINRNKNDNRRENLRIVLQSDNVKNKSLQKNNRSGVTGVCFRDDINKWSAYIRCDGIIHRLGHFNDKNDAIKARLEAEKIYFGEFSAQKHLFEKYNIY